jgi:hypothetical protein
VNAATWSLLELSLAAVTASLPTLRALIVKIAPQISSLSSRKLYADIYSRQGISQGADVETGTGTVCYGSAQGSAASTSASTSALRKSTDYQHQLQNLEQNDRPRSHDPVVTYISASHTTSKGTNLEVNTEKGNGILATTIVTQEFVDKK